MRLLVVGAGSTGGYFGGRLVQAGQDVTFLVRPGRAAQLGEKGLTVKSPRGDFAFHPQVATAETLSGTFEAILLTVKGFQLEAALDDIAPAVGSDTMILPVLNGMKHVDTITRRFNAHNVVGCALKVATTLEDDGSIVQLNSMQDLAFGELNGSASARVDALDAFFQAADIGARKSPAIHREMWEKWILLASLGATTCLARGTIGDIEASTGGTDYVLQMLDEAIAIVTAVGIPPSEAFIQQARAQLTAKGSPLASSMYRDLQRGHMIEVENIIGDLVRHAEQAGVAAPLLRASYVHLQVYQNQRN